MMRMSAKKMANGTPSIVALRYLLEVVEAGSFSHAAARLRLTPSTLSRRVAEVEDQLGLTLLERARSGIRITSGGRGVIKQIRRMLGELDAVEKAARFDGVGNSAEIRIGVRMPPIAGLLLNLFTNWRQQHPDIALKLFELNDHELRHTLAERSLDAAFVTKHTLWPGATGIPIYREAITAALPQNHPLIVHESLEWAQLRSETLLTQGWNDSQTAREFFASLLGSGVEFVSHSVSKQSILALVAAGYGITLATESQSLVSSPGIVFRPIAESNAWVEVNLVWPPESEDAAVGLFIAFMRDRSSVQRV
jgi:DNA-binding transcriptional LysR family regulator